MSTLATNRRLHPACRPLSIDSNGPFEILPDDRLATVDEHGLRISADNGATWEALPARFGQITGGASTRLVCTTSGVLVMLYLDMANYNFTWDDAIGEPKADCLLELWAARSLDGGQTWVDRQCVLDGYNANFFGFIQLRGGRLVASVERLVTDPGRWVACSLTSDDDGHTWRRSHYIDLGGHGHHDGALEPTLEELTDGRLLMLIRTNWDRFWQAISDDGGLNWRTVCPTDIDASSSPGQLLRLRSGRLALIWNRLNPEQSLAAKSVPGAMSEHPASWQREELVIAFSEDDGATWTPPLIIARQPGGQISYPHLFERRPGTLWLIAELAFNKWWEDPNPLRLEASEEALLRAAMSG